MPDLVSGYRDSSGSGQGLLELVVWVERLHVGRGWILVASQDTGFLVSLCV